MYHLMLSTICRLLTRRTWEVTVAFSCCQWRFQVWLFISCSIQRRAHVDSRDVRLALLLATNRVDIIDRVYFNFSAVAWAPLSLSTAYSHTGYDNTYDQDLGRAQALLMEAGYEASDSDGVDGSRWRAIVASYYCAAVGQTT